MLRVMINTKRYTLISMSLVFSTVGGKYSAKIQHRIPLASRNGDTKGHSIIYAEYFPPTVRPDSFPVLTAAVSSNLIRIQASLISFMSWSSNPICILAAI